MSYVCRFNPNPKMKSITRREIHEQKCPDRLKKQNEYKLCPYNPYHYVRNESYEKHIKDCKDKPKISFQEEDKEKAKALDDIISEQEQIKYARMKYYKDCIQEPKIVGISDKNMKNLILILCGQISGNLQQRSKRLLNAIKPGFVILTRMKKSFQILILQK